MIENPPVEFKRNKKQSEDPTFIRRLVESIIDSKNHENDVLLTLPLMLSKSLAAREKFTCPLQIRTYFDLSQYIARQEEKSLDALLKLIQDIIREHNDSQVLDQCSRCLHYLCDERSPIYGKCNLARATILDDLVSIFKKKMEDTRKISIIKLMNDEGDEFFPLKVALRRLAAFAEDHSMVNYDIIDHTLEITECACSEYFEFEPELATKVSRLRLRVCFVL